MNAIPSVFPPCPVPQAGAAMGGQVGTATPLFDIIAPVAVNALAPVAANLANHIFGGQAGAAAPGQQVGTFTPTPAIGGAIANVAHQVAPVALNVAQQATPMLLQHYLGGGAQAPAQAGAAAPGQQVGTFTPTPAIGGAIANVAQQVAPVALNVAQQATPMLLQHYLGGGAQAPAQVGAGPQQQVPPIGLPPLPTNPPIC